MPSRAAAHPLLGAGSWHFENDRLAALRAKIVHGRKTLGEVYGPPLYGIKTGLNDAFVIDRGTRDRLAKADPKASELMRPYVRGEHIEHRLRLEFRARDHGLDHFRRLRIVGVLAVLDCIAKVGDAFVRADRIHRAQHDRRPGRDHAG